jgi:hypothetical protein
VMAVTEEDEAVVSVVVIMASEEEAAVVASVVVVAAASLSDGTATGLPPSTTHPASQAKTQLGSVSQLNVLPDFP